LEAFPAPSQPPCALVPEAPLRALQEVADELIRLDRSSRARKARRLCPFLGSHYRNCTKAVSARTGPPGRARHVPYYLLGLLILDRPTSCERCCTGSEKHQCARHVASCSSIRLPSLSLVAVWRKPEYNDGFGLKEQAAGGVSGGRLVWRRWTSSCWASTRGGRSRRTQSAPVQARRRPRCCARSRRWPARARRTPRETMRTSPRPSCSCSPTARRAGSPRCGSAHLPARASLTMPGICCVTLSCYHLGCWVPVRARCCHTHAGQHWPAQGPPRLRIAHR
jgi:hypothetical protein